MSIQPKDLNYVQNVNLQEYMGTWYAVKEIPSYLGVPPFGYDSTKFVNETATYILNDDGTVNVINTAYVDGVRTAVEGTARQVDVGKIEVSFFFGFWAPYQIIGLDEGYRWAVVGSPDHNHLWYLAREPSLSAVQLAKMDFIAEANGFDVNRLVLVKQA